jgi:Electron transfer DM13
MPETLETTSVIARVKRPSFVLLAIPQVILFGGMLVMLVVHPNAVRSGLMSTRAVLVNAVLFGGWLLLSFVVLPKLVRNVWVRSGILTAIAIVAVIVLVVPTLRDKKVVEAFPVPEAATQPASGSGAAGGADADAATPTTTTPQPVQVSTGEFRGIDHDATGRGSIYRIADGSFVVALEDIDIEPGPDYQVYVVRGDDQETPEGGTHLSGLRGNQGTQYYEVPRDVGDVGGGWTILVWCRAFGVPVANATQSPI